MTDRELIAQAEALKAVPMPLPDTTQYAQWQGQPIKYHSLDQIIEFANARVAAAPRAQAEQPAEQGEPVAHLVTIKTADAGETKFFTAPSDPRGFPVYRDSKASLRQVQKLLRGLSFKDAKITQALECIHRALEGDDQDPRIAALEGLTDEVALIRSVLNGYPQSMARADALRAVERIEAALGE